MLILTGFPVLFLVQDIYSPEEALLPGRGFDFIDMAFCADRTSLAAFPALLQQVRRLQMRTFLLAMEVTTIHEFEQLYRQMHVDMLSKAFRGTCVVKIVYGKRAR